MTSLYSDLMERALRVAAVAHRNQVRKGGDLPYISHAFAVALILIRAGFDNPDLLAAAVLHDVIEDTAVTPEELLREFPNGVVEFVVAVSEIKTGVDGAKVRWEERKREHIERMSSADPLTCALCLADKLHNLMSMDFDQRTGLPIQTMFTRPWTETLDYYERMLAACQRDDERLAPLQDSCRRVLDHFRSSAW